MGTENNSKPWQDVHRPVAERVAALLAAMTLQEKVGQLFGVWIGVERGDEDVAPHQHEFSDPELHFPTLLQTGLGQLTRPFGTAPVDPTDGAKALARLQTEVAASNRFGIPALVHEECLTGFMTWQATLYPSPLAWGATFHPALIEQMAHQIGTGMRGVGVHQGLAPVLDVTLDPRWGRTEETVGEDPYLVATVNTAYVRGLQSAGVLATLKHFVGYSASTAGRNLAPVEAGPRLVADVLLPPFEMAVRAGRASSVMSSYTAIDGVPTIADVDLLQRVLREQWGFDGTLVSDYFGISFLERLHAVADDPGHAAAIALRAGVDVELPTVRCYGEPLRAAVAAGQVEEALIDQAVIRVLTQKCELGLLDPDWTPVPPALREPATGGGAEVDLDPPAGRRLAEAIAEQSVVLLANDGTLPLAAGPTRIAVIGARADDPQAMLGCYSFPNHVRHELGDEASEQLGAVIPTVLMALREEFSEAQITYHDGGDLAGAAEAAAAAQLCLAVVGDRAGLFGRGTSGEGCDATDLRLPGNQEQLLATVAGTGTPAVAVLLAGRPYALGAVADQLAAIVQAFFPGQAGGAAVAGVLAGRVNPSGRLPVSVPRMPGGQPSTYLAAPLAQRSAVSNLDPTPLFPFGHGLSYTSFEWEPVGPAAQQAPTDGTLTASVRVRNTGARAGVEVVQLYLHDPVAQVVQPVVRLVGYARVPLAAGESRLVTMQMPADLASFTGLSGRRVVEPGTLELRLGASCLDTRHTVVAELVGPHREVDHHRRLTTEVTVE